MLSESELVKLLVQGDRSAQRQFYDCYAGRMLSICRRYVRTTAEAEDILQEGFIKAFNHIKSFRSESSLFTWLTRIVIRTALNAKRQQFYLMPMVDLAESGLEETEPAAIGNLEAEKLIEIIQELPEGCRVIFNLYALEGYTHKEIAEMLNISEGTSKSQYSRARQLLRDKIMKTVYSNEYGKAAI